jgi:hypothetical protein
MEEGQQARDTGNDSAYYGDRRDRRKKGTASFCHGSDSARTGADLAIGFLYLPEFSHGAIHFPQSIIPGASIR